MAAVVGTLVGLAAVAFDKGVAWLQNQTYGRWYILLIIIRFRQPSLFSVGAGDVLGDLWVRKHAPEAGGSGDPWKLKGRWKINVPFAGGVYCR